jgi:hypothetical protein
MAGENPWNERANSRRNQRAKTRGISGPKPVESAYVDGPSLQDQMAMGSLSWPEAKSLLLQISTGLGAAHAAGVIHRDVKPSNVLMARDGTAKLTDFGIARGLDMTRFTATSAILGTPAYLAPEGPRDVRSDLYSLGIVAYELVTGEVPFKGATYQEIIVEHIRSAPDLTSLPIDAQPVVSWLLAKDPGARPHAAAELIAVLEERLLLPTALAIVTDREPELLPVSTVLPEKTRGPGLLAASNEGGVNDFRLGSHSPSPLSEDAETLFGPMAKDVIWLLESLPAIDPYTAAKIAEAYGTVPDKRRQAAGDRLVKKFSRPPFNAQLDNAELRVDRWAESHGSRGDYRVTYDIVARAAKDAACALILQDVLDQATYDTLYGPWELAMDSRAEQPDQGGEPGDETALRCREDDAKDFGPQTELVLALLDRLNHVTRQQIADLSTAPQARDADRIDSAWDELTRVSDEKPRWRQQCEAVANEIARWRTGQRSPYFDYSTRTGSTTDCGEASSAVLEAATALVMADLIGRDVAEILYSAWNRVVGHPALPPYSDE